MRSSKAYPTQEKLKNSAEQFLKTLSYRDADALIIGDMAALNMANFPANIKITKLPGGFTNFVYQLTIDTDTMILKTYPFNEDYIKTQARLTKVKNLLADSISSVLGIQFCSREIINDLTQVIGLIEISEYFKHGNLETKIPLQITPEMSEEAILTEHLKIISTCANIVRLVWVFSKLKIAYPDCKLSNLFSANDVIDGLHNLRVPDYKTLCYFENWNAITLEEIIDNGISKEYLPKEIAEAKLTTICDLYAMIKYTVGQCIYEFATGDKHFRENKNHKIDTTNKLIQIKEFREVVESLMDSKPNNRMDLKEAFTKLQAIIKQLKSTKKQENSQKSNSPSNETNSTTHGRVYKQLSDIQKNLSADNIYAPERRKTMTGLEKGAKIQEKIAFLDKNLTLQTPVAFTKTLPSKSKPSSGKKSETNSDRRKADSMYEFTSKGFRKI